eukprot:1554284-Rhodomonas_salina.3
MRCERTTTSPGSSMNDVSAGRRIENALRDMSPRSNPAAPSASSPRFGLPATRRYPLTTSKATLNPSLPDKQHTFISTGHRIASA